MPSPGLLITGTHYSGSTWIGQVLARAPKVGYVHEPFNPCYPPNSTRTGINSWYTYVNVDVDQYANRHYSESIGRLLGFRLNGTKEFLASRSRKSKARVLRDVTLFMQWRWQCARPLVKDPTALLSAEWLNQTFDLQPVVVVRHPAAFALSMKQRNARHPFNHFLRQEPLMRGPLAPYEGVIRRFAEEDQGIIDQAGLLWRILVGLIIEYRKRHQDWLFIRYEDIAQDPNTSFQILFSCLDLDYTPAVTAYIAKTTAANNHVDIAGGRGYVYRDTNKVLDRWRDRLTPEEVKKIRDWVVPVAGAFYDENAW